MIKYSHVSASAELLQKGFLAAYETYKQPKSILLTLHVSTK